MNIQTAYAKALLVDRSLRRGATRGRRLGAHRILLEAFETTSDPCSPLRAELGVGLGPVRRIARGGYAQALESERGIAGGRIAPTTGTRDGAKRLRPRVRPDRIDDYVEAHREVGRSCWTRSAPPASATTRSSAPAPRYSATSRPTISSGPGRTSRPRRCARAGRTRWRTCSRSACRTPVRLRSRRSSEWG